MRSERSSVSDSGPGPGVAGIGGSGPFERPADGGKPILALFAGSTLMGDDGVGLAALERLRTEWDVGNAVELLDGGTWGMNLLPAIESAERLVVVDAVRSGREPGTVVRLEEDEIPRFFASKLSPHQIDLKEVLALAELRGTLPRTVALGVEPGRVELTTQLSPEVDAAVPILVRRLVALLTEWGAEVEGREGTAAREREAVALGRPCALERAPPVVREG